MPEKYFIKYIFKFIHKAVAMWIENLNKKQDIQDLKKIQNDVSKFVVLFL